jgi:hypothetical protein
MVNKVFWACMVLCVWFAKNRFVAEISVDYAKQNPTMVTALSMPENDLEAMQAKAEILLFCVVNHEGNKADQMDLFVVLRSIVHKMQRYAPAYGQVSVLSRAVATLEGI